jgi:hypothetical protein
MKISAVKDLRQKLADGVPVHGIWVRACEPVKKEHPLQRGRARLSHPVVSVEWFQSLNLLPSVTKLFYPQFVVPFPRR